MRPKELQLLNQTRGTSLIEFALVLPILALIIFGVLDLGFAVYAKNTVALAAREGARAGIIVRQTDAQTRQAIRNQACSTAQVLNLDCSGTSNIQITPSTPITHSTRIMVTVVYTYTPFTPFIGGIIGNGGFPLSSSASMVAE